MSAETTELFVGLLGPALASILYMIAFATPNWVEIEGGDFSWGLWMHCDNTTTGRKRNCEMLTPGEMEGYFEAARVLSCFALVCYGLVFIFLKAFVTKIDDYRGYYLLLCSVSEALLPIVLILMGTGYEDDNLWNAKGPVLGYSYWLTVAVVIITTIALATQIFFVCAHRKRLSCKCRCLTTRCRKKKKLASRVAPVPLPPRPPEKKQEETKKEQKTKTLSKEAFKQASSCHSSVASVRSVLDLPDDTNVASSFGEGRAGRTTVLPISEVRSQLSKTKTSSDPPRHSTLPPSPPSPTFLLHRRSQTPPPPLRRSRSLEQKSREEDPQPLLQRRLQRLPSPPLMIGRAARVEREAGVDDAQHTVIVVGSRRHGEDSPVPDLPRYDFPPAPEGSDPSVPPPAYEDVVTHMQESRPPSVSHPEDL